jgi:hypothetical protein
MAKYACDYLVKSPIGIEKLPIRFMRNPYGIFDKCRIFAM